MGNSSLRLLRAAGVLVGLVIATTSAVVAQ